MQGNLAERRFIWAAAALALALAARAGAQSPTWDLGANLASPAQWSVYGRDANAGVRGLPVAGGDFDGDGLSDLAFTGTTTDAWIVLSTGAGREVDLFTINPSSPPADVVRIARDPSPGYGSELYGGDFNNDGIDDLLIGSQTTNSNAGAAYIVWGSAALGGDVIFLGGPPPPGLTVTRIAGLVSPYRAGLWVSGADADGDGIEDILLTADQTAGSTSAPPVDKIGSAYVAYGVQGSGPGTLVGTEGAFNSFFLNTIPAQSGLTTIHGVDANDHFGATMAGGDLDGNGRAELIVSAALNRSGAAFAGQPGSGGADGPLNGRSNCGETYVIWDSDVPARATTIDLRTAPPVDVTTIIGSQSGSFTGEELWAADIDGDGLNDLIIGAITANSGRGGVWIIYNDGTLRGKTIDLAAVNPTTGIVNAGGADIRTCEMRGALNGDILGDTVRAVDLNLDGRSDLMIGVPNMATSRVYILFGSATRLPPLIDFAFDSDLGDASLAPFFPLRVLEINVGDVLAYSMHFGDFDGDAVPDMLINGMNAQAKIPANVFRPGNAYYLSGRALTAAAGAPPPPNAAGGDWRDY